MKRDLEESSEHATEWFMFVKKNALLLKFWL